MVPHRIRALLVDGDEDDYVIIRTLLSNIKGPEYALDGRRLADNRT